MNREYQIKQRYYANNIQLLMVMFGDLIYKAFTNLMILLILLITPMHDVKNRQSRRVRVVYEINMGSRQIWYQVFIQ